MTKVYELDLGTFYYPPMKDYPIYSYHFYSFKIFNILKKFNKKKNNLKFKTTSNNNNNTYLFKEKLDMYQKVGQLLKQFDPLFKKLKCNNIEKDLKTLRALSFYLQIFESTRNYFGIMKQLKEIIGSIDSIPIDSKILEKIKLYKENSNIPIKEEDWNSIKMNELVFIESPFKLPVRIKQFNDSILKLNKNDLTLSLINPSISQLNFDGLCQQSIIKYSNKIEEYSKKLLKEIFASDIYINNFLKHDIRFGTTDEDKNKLEKLLKSMFRGKNKDFIFDEIWNNIFFFPFLELDFSGYNNRNQYAIFINSIQRIKYDSSFQKIVPRMHSEINSLYHEFTHNISLLLAANLENINFETQIIAGNQELIDMQNEFSLLYNQNSILYNNFDDFGNLMEVELYGIRPRIFKTFSGLFCLDFNSYKLSPENFRKLCVELYNYNSEDIKNDELKNLINNLMNSEITKILIDIFKFDEKLNNESFIENGKARQNAINTLFNDEFIIEIDYCDKLN